VQSLTSMKQMLISVVTLLIVLRKMFSGAPTVDWSGSWKSGLGGKFI
jgi:hypothetical protein